MLIRISSPQLRLLETEDETKHLVANLFVRKSDLFLEGSGEAFADLREACGDLLIRIGFDEDYKANANGKMLEDLIDTFFVG